MMSNLYRDLYTRLHSAHGVRYAVEIAAVNARYSVNSDALPLPAESEINDYHDWGHLWTPAALLDFLPRYKAYLQAAALIPLVVALDELIPIIETFIIQL